MASLKSSPGSFSVVAAAKPVSPSWWTVSRLSSAADAAYTVPSSATASAASSPTWASGSLWSARLATLGTPTSESSRVAHRRPAAASSTARLPPAIPTTGVPGMDASSPSGTFIWAGSSGTTTRSDRLMPTTESPSWTMSRLASTLEKTVPSSSPMGLLIRPYEPSRLLVTQMPPSFRSAWWAW